MSDIYTLLILAGGRGTRMGGRDKGLVRLDGDPLVARLLETLNPAPTRVVISANRNAERYQRWADRVVPDLRPDFSGPMAGLEAGLQVSQGPLLCLPCDLIDPPARLAALLLAHLTPGQVNVIEDQSGLQPLCLALHAEPWRNALGAYLDQGGRSARGWLANVAHQRIVIDGRLGNLNSL
ncbi:molybdenum cofactor guanylyltransferase [Alcanivorax sp. N3-2A]|nr:molybdenum cofactor guanylyltransferase [Alcanivorax sp. N3-2A]|tara:strand:+ start:5032 stop:5571 length:540 start_codon:yes stop_codon:yes gene_type:complete